MKTITIKNLTIQVDISKAHGNMVADALTVIDLINLHLEKLNDLNPQILASGLDSSDIEVNNEIKTDDDGNCVFCGAKCFEGEMCDEQQADGF